MDVQELELDDLLAVKSLKYLRQRSMRNPRWRSAERLQRFIKRDYLRWAVDSPLEPQRVAAQRALDAYKVAEKKRRPDMWDPWRDVRAAVDHLIGAAETIAGHSIKAGH